jgi:D-aminoacyl-tRNA deacylase
MRLLLQRVQHCSLVIDGQEHSRIDHGLLALVGIEADDTREDADWLVSKMVRMRIFSDEEGKMNKDVIESGGSIMVVSQFTLHASTKKGNRPSFIRAARPEQAIPLYDYFVQQASSQLGHAVATGVFGADMKITLLNDGPVTIWMDSKEKE